MVIGPWRTTADSSTSPPADPLGLLKTVNLCPGLRDLFDYWFPCKTILMELQMLSCFHWAFLWKRQISKGSHWAAAALCLLQPELGLPWPHA